ncbi:LysE family translocator [Halocynthiibacter sp.]|uniref:LysE family translocator n=1 Tax=Halocynthiibacter sp. TaxID=1979210 RepID=UPI003C6FE5DA
MSQGLTQQRTKLVVCGNTPGVFRVWDVVVCGVDRIGSQRFFIPQTFFNPLCARARKGGWKTAIHVSDMQWQRPGAGHTLFHDLRIVACLCISPTCEFSQTRRVIQVENQIPSLLIFLFPLAWSPGPGNLIFAATGARYGFRATLPLSLGYHAAKFLVSLVLGLGMLQALAPGSIGFTVLKVVGALYILRMALCMLLKGGSSVCGGQEKAGLFTGAALLLCNPKAHVITLLMFAQFPIAPEDPDALQKVIVISTIFTLNNCVAFAFWTLIGEQIFKGFRIGATQEVLQRVFGLSLMFVSGWMLV